MPQAHSDNPVYDLLICGGGLVGASLALMLKPLGLRVAMIEATAFAGSAHPSFDERTTALSNGSRRVFEAVGVWPLLQRTATPIKRIHVSDQGRFGFARLSAQEQGLAALGHVVPNWQMGAALWQRLQEEQIEIIAPARVVQLDAGIDSRRVTIDSNGQQTTLSARLIVAADGAQSLVRDAAGIGNTQWDYGHTALICNALTQRFHEHVAYERFTPRGALAVLPLSDARVGLIWTMAHAAAAEALSWSDDEFLARFQQEFGFRLGRFLKVGARHAYPLSLVRAVQHHAERIAVIGNAAQMLHPIAGQGLNLGLRDAASLAELLADGLRADPQLDIGNAELLQHYADWRQQDSKRIVAFTDGLVRLFNQRLGLIKFARDAGLLAFDLMPAAKDAMAQLSMGASGRIPRLARGAPL
ncbi:MAG: 2-octaprenyl-6-methoxyphenyl hydroxylase [Steroidobacteraceae bacterium]